MNRHYKKHAYLQHTTQTVASSTYSRTPKNQETNADSFIVQQ